MSPALQALPSGAVAVDYVDIGDVPTEVGHNLAGWGPVEPATTGGAWGGEDHCRVIWEAGSPDVYALVGRTATIDMDFGSTLGTKFLALRWLDGIGYDDGFDFTVSGVAGTFSVTDGAPGHSETWRDLGVWNVGPITGWHTVTLSATGTAWGSFGTYGQCAFSEMATFVANCWPEPPAEVTADPALVAEPTGAIQIDFVDIGKPSSEAGHTMSSWGPVVPPPGAFGGEDDCRVIWDTGSDTDWATIDMDFGEAPGSKYVALRWLDGIGYDDGFDMTIAGVAGTFSLTDGTTGHGENWYFLCVWDVGPVVGVRTITLTATGAKWSMWDTYGQVAFSQIATLSDVCDGCGPADVPTDVVADPALELLPDCAVRVDFVDIGDPPPGSEAGHNLQGWGPVVPPPGAYGGEDDCKVIWEAGSPDVVALVGRTATIDMDFGTGTGQKYLAMRWLDGISYADSFQFTVAGATFTLTDNTSGHPETWYDLCVWDVGAITGVHTITLTATGAAWSQHGTYGQVAFSTMSTYEEFCEAAAPAGIGAGYVEFDPVLSALPANAITIDYVDIGDAPPGSEAGHNLQGWGAVVPLPGAWGGEDDCRVIWEKASPDAPALVGKCATIDLDFGAAVGTKYLAMRWLDGIANDGVVQGAHDSFRFTVSGSDTVYTVHDLTVAHGEDWYDLCVWDVGMIKGVHTVTLCALGKKWAGFNTYGQVGFSEMATKMACPSRGTSGRDGDTTNAVKVNATVRLLGVQGPVTRCVKFTVGDAFGGCAAPNHVDVLFAGNPATGTVTFEVDDDVWTRINAKDEQHAVSATSTLSLAGSAYYADVALDLRGGDTDNNDVVEIDDVTWLIATFGEAADGGTHPWDSVRCADFSDNGFVGTEDFTFLAESWLAFEDFQCGGGGENGRGGSGAGEPLLQGARASAPVADLPVWAANRADLNGDRVVDVEDVKRFEQLHGLGNELSSKMEMTASQQPTKEKAAR